MIGAYRVKPTSWEATRIGAIMNRSDRCPECNGDGLVPPLGCTYDGNAHTYMPAICAVCGGSGRAVSQPYRRSDGLPQPRRPTLQP